MLRRQQCYAAYYFNNVILSSVKSLNTHCNISVAHKSCLRMNYDIYRHMRLILQAKYVLHIIANATTSFKEHSHVFVTLLTTDSKITITLWWSRVDEVIGIAEC